MARYLQKNIIVDAIKYDGTNVQDVQNLHQDIIAIEEIKGALFVITFERTITLYNGDWLLKPPNNGFIVYPRDAGVNFLDQFQEVGGPV